MVVRTLAMIAGSKASKSARWPGKSRDPAHVAPARKERFTVRMTVERADARLKEWLVPAQIFVRGVKKVSFQLLCGLLCLAGLKVLQYFILSARRECDMFPIWLPGRAVLL